MNSRRFWFNPTPIALGSALMLLSGGSALGQWSIPQELQERASALSGEQLEFISSGEILKFIPERQVEHELATRDPEALRSLVDDLIK